MDYYKIYNQLVETAKSKNRVRREGVYYEVHHIIPQCLGGTGKRNQYSHHPNLVLLTPREHFVAHQLLCKIYPNESKLKFTLWAMCNQQHLNRQYKVSSRIYESSRLEYIALVSGKPKTEQHKKKLSESMKGIPRGPMSNQWVNNLKESLYGLKKSNTHKANLSKAKSIPRFQYDLEGNFIKRWESAKQAGIALNIDPGGIVGCCNGKKKMTGGFIWKNELCKIDITKLIHANSSEIHQYDLNGKYINTFKSINEAAKALKVNASGISNCANGYSKSAGGFVWRYQSHPTIKAPLSN